MRADPDDPYARLYSAAVVDAVNGSTCRATAWATMSASKPNTPPTQAEAKQLQSLGARANA